MRSEWDTSLNRSCAEDLEGLGRIDLRDVAVVGLLAAPLQEAQDALPDRRDEECDILVGRLGEREEAGARLGEERLPGRMRLPCWSTGAASSQN